VETDDGRTLFGFDAEVYEKLKAKEDPELERKVVTNTKEEDSFCSFLFVLFFCHPTFIRS
jgi:hypothetical protein